MRSAICYALFVFVLLTGVSAANLQPVEIPVPKLLGDVVVDQALVSQARLSRQPISHPIPDYGYNDVVGDPAAISFYINSPRDPVTSAPRIPATDEMVDIIQGPCRCTF